VVTYKRIGISERILNDIMPYESKSCIFIDFGCFLLSVKITYYLDIPLDIPLDINKKQLYNRIIKTLQCERLELFLWDLKESSIISLGGKKKSISKYLW